MRPPAPDGSRNTVGHTAAVPAATGFLGAPLAEALTVLPPRPGSLMDAPLNAGGCFVRPLPMDTTCAAAARKFFREAVENLPIPSGLQHDGVTMASELAANTLHAQRKAALAAGRQRVATVPEIWLYLRGSARAGEIVCKIFDSERDWDGTVRMGLDKAPADSVSGRGLQVVDGLSAGMWGCHPTVSRLGATKTPGKAVWFAQRVPPASLPDDLGRPRFGPEWLTDELEAMLMARGMQDIVRADAGGISVLSISRHLTVWRHGQSVSWRASSGRYQRLDLADLVDAAEQIVWAHEESALAEAASLGGQPWPAAADLAAS
jgi:hypothetical protein